jgi:predicted enzyme related to lactoylglutathione lyase
MVDHHARFVWYELMTTDAAAASAFYSAVIGWDAQDASKSGLAYTMLNAGGTAVGGLMELPEQATRQGATPRWMGYVGVDDVDLAADRLKRLGGALYVPPTDTNIGRIAVVADPQTTNLALIGGHAAGRQTLAELDRPGHVGWHELLAVDWEKALAFYRELFDWQKAAAEVEAEDTYQLFSAGGQTIGGMFNKRPMEPLPFWLFYFNVEDIDAAAARVTAGGGQVVSGPLDLPSGFRIARCRDPQGAAFALQGRRREDGIGFTAEWGGFSSRGRVVNPKPRS